jgi:sulfide:quinone oxidoreductase
MRLIRQLVGDIEDGLLRRVVFVVPAGCSWPLPAYELALLSAARAAERGLDVELSVVSPEQEPLAVFGPDASLLVGDLLDKRGVRFIHGIPVAVRRDGALMLQSDGAIAADRVVAVPELRARRIVGVPGSWGGFVPTDVYGGVEGLTDVYAAGDMTTYPVKQGGLAAQQADRIAHTIAAGLGVPVKEFRAGHVLRTRLLGGQHPLYLRAELDWSGLPTAAAIEHAFTHRAASSAKVFGRYLTPYLETLEPLPAGQLAVA